jgi:hypothetical protein
VIKASEARLSGVNNKELQRLTESGELERIGHGLYIDAEHMEDEYFITQYRCAKGVYSHETTLFRKRQTRLDSFHLKYVMLFPIKPFIKCIRDFNPERFIWQADACSMFVSSIYGIRKFVR